MEKRVIELLGLVFKMLIRYWARDSEVLSQNIVDVEQFAQQCGLSIWEAKKFNRSIDDFIDTVAEDFIREVGNEIDYEERKKAILSQIINDVKKININKNKLVVALSNPEDLGNVIMFQSQKERETWNDVENGIYTNCVRYISRISIDFVSKLPSFTPEALKIVIRRQEAYHKELNDILADIHSMTSLIKSVEVTYREYERIYREKLIEKYSKIELIGSGLKDRNITRYDISSAYVELNCINEYGYEDEIELSQVFSDNNVVWIKGEAGSGKTTFLQWVAVCAAKNEYQKIENIRNTIPIVIGLRNAEWPLNLQDSANKITGIYGSNCPDGWILELLKKNRAILLFDGLDEISPKKREETYNFIECMVGQYPQIKVLLTARNSVNDNINCDNICYEIMPMKMENIRKFVLYWHRSVLWRDAIIKDEEINCLQYNLIKKIVSNQPLKSLAKNPLLCAMICALNFVNNEQLPNDKMELYEKCCEMLMDARDTQRQIDSSIYGDIPKMDYSRKRKILEEMAYWMMNGGVSSESKQNVTNYLEHLIKDTNILPERNKEYNAEAILNFFIERSGIIREPEEGEIDFIHKTFMEFLAVKAICRNCAWSVLIKEACNVNWKETIIMCFQEMGKENVEYVLKKLMIEGEFKNDDRYILMASLSASNAVFLANNKIKEEIDAKIRTMIPPEYNKIYEIAQAGTYLLPFLKESDEFSDSEKEKCLSLLAYLETEETIPNILSYVSGKGNDNVKMHALNLLSLYENSILEEYNVRDELLNIMISSVAKESLVTYETMINLLCDKELSEKNIKVFTEIKSLRIVCGTSEDNLYMGETEFLWYLKDCETVILNGDIKNIDFLDKFTYIKDLMIETYGDFSEAMQKLMYFKNLVSVKKLYIKAERLDYFCELDLKQMKNLEYFEIHCQDDKLEIDIDGFKNLPKLKGVLLDFNIYLEEEILEKVSKWKIEKPDCEFICANVESLF